jgi:COP9 signalosome complex subunit 7
MTANLNPAAQTVVITSVAPLRDLAPGSITDMISELSAWSGRCDTVLADLEAEISKVRWEAKKRAMREQKAEKQVKAVMEASEKGSGSGAAASRANANLRPAAGSRKLEQDDEEEDPMDVDGGSGAAGLGGGAGKKRSAGGGGGIGEIMRNITGKGGR